MVKPCQFGVLSVSALLSVQFHHVVVSSVMLTTHTRMTHEGKDYVAKTNSDRFMPVAPLTPGTTATTGTKVAAGAAPTVFLGQRHLTHV